jgi:hypothetical protein
LRGDAKFIHTLDDAADVVAQDFRQGLILHGNVRLAPDMVAELRLYHRKGAFDVAPLMVMLQEFFLVHLEVIKCWILSKLKNNTALLGKAQTLSFGVVSGRPAGK